MAGGEGVRIGVGVGIGIGDHGSGRGGASAWRSMTTVGSGQMQSSLSHLLRRLNVSYFKIDKN